MTRLLQLSDVHIRKRPRARDNVQFQKVVAGLLKLYRDREKPVIAVTGDVTQNGRKGEFSQAVALMRPLQKAGFELFIVPGNHDVAEHGSAFRRKARLAFQQSILGELLGLQGASVETIVMDQMFPLVRRFGNVRVIGLDTANREDFLATGRCGKMQLQRLDALLAEPRQDNERTVLCLHHHPFYRDIGHCLIDSAELQAVIRNRCDVLMFGHRHRSERWRHKLGIPIVFAAGQTNAPVKRRLANGKKQRYFEVRRVDFGDDGKMLSSVDQVPV